MTALSDILFKNNLRLNNELFDFDSGTKCVLLILLVLSVIFVPPNLGLKFKLRDEVLSSLKIFNIFLDQISIL